VQHLTVTEPAAQLDTRPMLIRFGDAIAADPITAKRPEELSRSPALLSSL
jgi:hypothetical protein